MKIKVISIIVGLLLVIGAGGFYYCYENHLRFTDGYTDCPVVGFRSAATGPDQAAAWVTEANLQSLALTERCSLDCKHGNHMACVLYGLALQKGVHVMKDVSASSETLKNACERGETLACDLEKRAVEIAQEAAAAEIRAVAAQRYKGVLSEIEKSKALTGPVVAEALAYFGGSVGPMTKGGMKGWYEKTVQYLLFDQPSLSGMHPVPGAKIDKSGLKQFVLAKYMGSDREPDFVQINEFLDKFLRLGVQQIKLDYRVEKKKESDLPKRHDYFRAKHTFLYNAGTTKIEILDELEKNINYLINNASTQFF